MLVCAISWKVQKGDGNETLIIDIWQ